MILIVGLGNPGIEYKNTRHNIGWIILDNILKNINWEKSSKGKLLYHRDDGIEYIKPQTFMNESGLSVSYIQKKYELNSQDIIVIHDDIDLLFNQIKISYDRGDGGHNGIKSIMNHLKSQSFIRIRVGVSILDENNILRKPDVLGAFSKNDLEIIKEKISPNIHEVIQSIILEGKEIAMNKFNSK
ncbi:MAG: aminoacyl-tRNA hydrolase [Candidatus Nomurabacteria bacterium]|nr:aminoacyl-tRNA hydrolase [Candidatus Nomurabacteria bacterium]